MQKGLDCRETQRSKDSLTCSWEGVGESGHPSSTGELEYMDDGGQTQGQELCRSEEVTGKALTPPGSPYADHPPTPPGLDDSLQDYCFEDWELPGKYLLQLCPRSLEALTVWPLGHQELILEGVEQLRALSSGLQSENLQSLTEGLLERIQAFQSLVQGHLRGCADTPANVLSAAVELVQEARSLLFWLNRYLFSHLNDFSSCQEIGELCRELGQALQEASALSLCFQDCPAAEKESKVLRIVSIGAVSGMWKWGGMGLRLDTLLSPRQCSHVVGICHSILSYSPEELREQRAVLERVPLDDPSGLEIHTTSNCLHFVSRVGPQVPDDSQLQILPGDEIVQVNEQVVVGWPHKNVVRELLREPDGVSLVLKKVPVPETPPQTPPQALSSSHPVSPSLAPAPLSPRALSEDVFAFDLTSNPSPGPSPAAWTDSTSFDPEPLPGPPAPPATLPTGVADTPEPLEHPDKVKLRGSARGGVWLWTDPSLISCGPFRVLSLVAKNQKPLTNRLYYAAAGMATQLSRRRVSCRELGRPDCDGWLLLRKVPGGFMGPRWRRCWFVLKGHTLYWYRQPQDEKAEGLINVSNYSLESGQDQKKK
ncbi:Connector enhancer of kinase suppressor of ras 1 [Camelus dromedarius]|uniref:Connector enhancer of kinase suppressor of ras 1 n=1 Tax=Camelus dromedarius TaxID=9838 RepID=A0A5N4DAK0_CAMDR|nr:Connector enhancer of kinase suppressor of ras 1 [Camelus dromedarius]